MENLRFYIEHWYIIPKAIFRLCFILLNNAYCIPTYVMWMILLSPIRKINPDAFWRIEGYFFHWLLAMVSMWSWSAGYDVVEVGDDITDCIDEKTLVIANHQSTADVPFLMACFNTRKNILPNLMWIMDRHHSSTVLNAKKHPQGKTNREKSLQALITHITESYIPRKRHWMVLFPEGGFLRKRRAVSQRYAQKNNLPILQHVSLPRVGALKAIMATVGPNTLANNNSTHVKDSPKNCESIRWVLDITIAYPNGQPLDLGTIIFGNRPPCKTTLFYRVYHCRDIPQNEEEQTKWLYKLFEEKETMLDVFYKTGKFPVTQFSQNPVQPHVVGSRLFTIFNFASIFITSTYVHMQIFLAAYEYYNYMMY
ncbi:1-acylglycerol-3-phosphate acyltransferase-related [Holotrichia oblita]|uniref:1-acylglycerol-3-phosphate acyltransferase-related n=1 Tax=Holotrichia oblita TaxID=644536 RepID=A0ACB9T8Q1_HOLOL|nr:1-acylglycerol-3-phosphate acyltransferase-related [Holotrichia oblita]